MTRQSRGPRVPRPAVPAILSRTTFEESPAVGKVYSMAGMLPADTPLIFHWPFRAPHHTASYAGPVGGGNVPRPGEISLAHRGVLCPDELPEFGTELLEMLRQPLEDRKLMIARERISGSLPDRIDNHQAHRNCPEPPTGKGEKRCNQIRLTY